MLQLMLGIAGTGKTTEQLKQMAGRADAGRESLFLVPEQFSSTAEMMVYNALGDEKSARVEVVSFRTLAERVLRATGGLAVKVLSDAGRAVFVRRALDALGSEVRTFARQRRSAAFCAMCADTVNELKTAGATPELLRQVGREAKEPKLEELALIFEAYESAIHNVALDPQDRLQMAAARVQSADFADTVCFIDNFDGFTAPEYAMLEKLLACCEGVVVALCCDGLVEDADGLGVFSPVRRTAQHLLHLAQKGGVRVAAPLELAWVHRCAAAGLQAVNLLLAHGDDPAAGSEGLTLTECLDEWQEVRLVAAKMHALAREGVPYSRMAVVCRDVAMYESSVRRAFALFDIPFFMDAPGTIEYTAPVAFLRAALRLLREGLASGAVLALLKSGLCGYSEAELAALENYVFTWAPGAAAWRAPFENNPAGLLARSDEVSREQLASAERLRGEVVPVLEDFMRQARGRDAAELSRQLYLLLDRLGAPQHIEALAGRLEAAGETAMVESSRRAWDVTMDLLDQMTALLGTEKVTAAEYDDLFLLLVRATDFGQVPQTLECAIFTSADRMRLADPDYCFVLGVCEGEFPMQVGYSGLLTHTDRELLVAGGVEMPGSFENRVLLEEMFFYRAMTSARKGLYISWPARRGGVVKSMSAALEPVRRGLAPGGLAVDEVEQCATPAAAFERLAGVYRGDTQAAASLYTALQRQGEMDSALRLLDEVDNDGQCAVAEQQALNRLVGVPMTLSATRAQSYYNCHYAYFMERVLRVSPRRKAEISPTESGTFVHYVLEQVLCEAGQGFGEMSDEKLREMCTKYADSFIAEHLPVDTKRAAHLLGRIKQTTAELLCFMRDGAKNSDFEIDALELPLTGADDGVEPLQVVTPGGHTMRVTGAIDRVDVLRKDGKSYLSIIDYKTGSKQFSLKDVYCGLNMQMLIYMHTLLQNAQQRYPDAVPAGVLYLLSDPPPTTGERGGGGRAPAFKVDGLLLNDPAVLRAMDRSAEGVFIPVRYNKNGQPRAGKQLASLEKIGNITAHVQQMLEQMVDGVYGGDFPAQPLVAGSARPCDWCAYRPACRHENGRGELLVDAPKDVFESGEEGGEVG